MKKYPVHVVAILILLLTNTASFGQGSLGINKDGSTPDPSALLDVKSTTQGILAPRMTAAQKTAIISPATGLLVYQVDDQVGFYVYDGTYWGEVAISKNPFPNYNQFIGLSSGSKNTTGFDNLFLGNWSGQFNTTGSANTYIGYRTGEDATTGNLNTCLGAFSAVLSNTSNSTAIGSDSYAGASNTIVLGNDRINQVLSSGVFTTYSDARFKYDVQSNVPGLSFILKLKPVTYHLDRKKLDTFTKTGVLQSGFNKSENEVLKTGFLAQDVEKAAKSTGFDFDGVHAPTGQRDPYTLSYAQFVVPLVKSVQELSQKMQKTLLKMQQMNRRMHMLEAENKKFSSPATKLHR